MACSDSRGMFSVGVEAIETKPGEAFHGRSGKALLDFSSCYAGQSCAAKLCCGSSSAALQTLQWPHERGRQERGVASAGAGAVKELSLV